jgi:cyclopropane fatty-acyl-phospholipid synthase-like methyltransferase
VAIQRAQRKAAERGVPATFLVKDALTLKDWTERFDNVIDSGLFHVFSDEDRLRYVEGLATVLKPGGRLFLMCFSDPHSHLSISPMTMSMLPTMAGTSAIKQPRQISSVTLRLQKLDDRARTRNGTPSLGGRPTT